MDRFSKHYDRLNGLQRLAVDSSEGQLLVLAGPGTGKTQLLSVRAASIIRKGLAAPGNILILTYTNAAAKAMKERLAEVIGPAGYDVEVGTFHSFANSIIQESAEAANYTGDRIPMSDVEAARAVEYALDTAEGAGPIRPFRSPYIYLKEIQRRIGDLKKEDVKPDDLDRYLAGQKSGYRPMEPKHKARLVALAAVYRRYEELKTGRVRGIFDERGRYDFDDMILFAVAALGNEQGLLDEYRSQYRYIMVDEFQDTNGAQMDLLFTLATCENANLCCVGDDDQSIYRFQGASVENFKRLSARFPLMRTVKLVDNYRSTPELVDLSRSVIGLVPADARVEVKTLKSVNDSASKEIVFNEFTTEAEELLYIVDKVGRLKKRIESSGAVGTAAYNSIAVLVRKREQILRVIDAFLQAGIPYATDGKEDIQSEIRVRQMIDVLELAHIDPRDIHAKDTALYSVLSSDYMEIPQADILNFISYVNRLRSSRPDATMLGELIGLFAGKKAHAVKDAPALKDAQAFARAAVMIKGLIEASPAMPAHKILLDFIQASGIYSYILREYGANGVLKIRQLRALGSFVNMVKSGDLANPGMRLADLLEDMRTRKNHGLPVQGDLVTMSQDGVRIFTAHGSKGMEFDSVVIPFCLQDRSWPVRHMAGTIRLPSDLIRSAARPDDKDLDRKLFLQDEARLFYVASTRARSSLILTASPSEGDVTSPYVGTLKLKPQAASGSARAEESLIARSLESAAAPDPFIGTEKILADMVSNMTLNPTRLNGYITCRRKFLYNDVLKLPGPKKRSLVFGNCVHKALEETYRKFMLDRRFPSFGFFSKEFARELGFQGVDAGMERECMNRLKSVERWFARAKSGAVMPIDLEKKLMVTVGDNIIFTGKYDKVEWDDRRKGTVKIVDYKTGKPDEHLKAIDSCRDLASPDCEGYLRQLVAYKLLFEKDARRRGGRSVSRGALVFIEPVSADMRRLGYSEGDYVTKEVEVTSGMVSELEEVIRSAWRDIRKLRFEKLAVRDRKTCGNCDFDNICWRSPS
jgi:DNA helicase-2/ATP-dependent DNA helicase PcrA